MATARDALIKRTIPIMELSDGSPSSMTAPPSKHPSDLTPVQRAERRFKITGNAIVTGGSGTLGYAACRALLEHGLTGLTIFDLNDAALESAVASLQDEFPSAKITCQTIDVTDEPAVESATKVACETLGSIDILLCFAGVVGCTHAIEMTAQEWRRTVDINMTGTFLCAQAVARHMVAAGTGGSIVFTSSISAHRVNFPQPQVAYNVSKAGVLAMKSSLAAEWARYGIRVNSLSPGYMDTILNEGPGLQVARDIWTSRNPMGRMGVPEELTGAILLLASSAGSYINGADIVCDGGGIVF